MPDPADGRFVLRAPIAGTGPDRLSVTAGAVIDGEEVLFRLADLSRIQAEAHAYERDAVRLQVGAHADVALSALPGDARGPCHDWAGRLMSHQEQSACGLTFLPTLGCAPDGGDGHRRRGDERRGGRERPLRRAATPGWRLGRVHPDGRGRLRDPSRGPRTRSGGQRRGHLGSHPGRGRRARRRVLAQSRDREAPERRGGEP
ncbi:MAG: efflux RND transporter periplasmic adaptor subunit [Deltaproteobacteria bacterium]|nr:efflux RND transporter periplasmic adaptor subunit [Deltaproteobacteria bacterium]